MAHNIFERKKERDGMEREEEEVEEEEEEREEKRGKRERKRQADRQRQRQRETERERGMESEREIEREREREREREKERGRDREILWRRGLVVDTWLRDQKVPGSSPGCARSTLSPWKRLFTCIFQTPLMCKTSTRL